MYRYTAQGYLQKKNYEYFADTNQTNQNNQCDSVVKQVTDNYDKQFSELKSTSELSLSNEKNECNKKITDLNKSFQDQKTSYELQFSEYKKNSENIIRQLNIDKEELNKKIDGQKSCDVLIKQSYADFEKQYEKQKNDCNAKITEHKENTDKTMKQFIIEKENWTKQFDLYKIESEKTLQEEKQKLETTKKLFEEKIKLIENEISKISLDIKKI